MLWVERTFKCHLVQPLFAKLKKMCVCYNEYFSCFRGLSLTIVSILPKMLTFELEDAV